MPEPSQGGVRSSRGGFVHAFTRSVRRDQKRSPVGAIAVSTLVAVIVAAVVVGMSFLLKGPETTPAAAASREPAPSSSAGSPSGAPAKGTTVRTQGDDTDHTQRLAQVPTGRGGVAPPPIRVVAPPAATTANTIKAKAAATGSTTATKPPTQPKANTVQAARAITGAGPIISYVSNKCIDVTDGAFSSNPQVQVWQCTVGPNQNWTFYSDGTVRAGGRCLAVAGGSSANGAKIVLNSCTGSTAQQFTLNSSLDLVNKHADKCVDVTDQNTADGAKLQLWSCGGTSNQKWHR